MLQLGRYGTHNGRMVRLTSAAMKTVTENGKPIEKLIYDGYLMPKADPKAVAGEAGEWEEATGPGRMAKYRTQHVNKSHAFDLSELVEAEGEAVVPGCANCAALEDALISQAAVVVKQARKIDELNAA